MVLIVGPSSISVKDLVESDYITPKEIKYSILMAPDPSRIKWVVTPSNALDEINATPSGSEFTGSEFVLRRFDNVDYTFTLKAYDPLGSATEYDTLEITVTKQTGVSPVGFKLNNIITNSDGSTEVTTHYLPSEDIIVNPLKLGMYDKGELQYWPIPSYADTNTSLKLGDPSAISGLLDVDITTANNRITIKTTGSVSDYGYISSTFSNSHGAIARFEVEIEDVWHASALTVKDSGGSVVSSLSIYKGESKTVYAYVTTNGSNGRVTTSAKKGTRIISTRESYLSSLKRTAITINAVAVGTDKLYVDADDGPLLNSHVISVTVVEPPVATTRITPLPDNPTYLELGESSLKYNFVAYPTNAVNREISVGYKDSNSSKIVSISTSGSSVNRSYQFTATAVGTAVIVIKATSSDPQYADYVYSEEVSFIVQQTVLVSRIYVNTTNVVSDEIDSLEIIVGKYEIIYILFEPNSASDKSITIEQSGGDGKIDIYELVAPTEMLNGKYRITGVTTGTCLLKVTSVQNPSVSKVITVNVVEDTLNNKYPYVSINRYSIAPYEEVSKTLTDSRYTYEGDTYRIHSGTSDQNIDLNGLEVHYSEGITTSIPPTQNALESVEIHPRLYGAANPGPRVFYIYVTNSSGETMANEITILDVGGYTKTLRFDANVPVGSTLVGTVPSPVQYTGTDSTTTYQVPIPTANISVSGYVFVGWRENTDATRDTVYNGASNTHNTFPMKGEDMDVTLYGEWFPIPDKATGTGTSADPFNIILTSDDLKKGYSIPNKGDYPIRYMGSNLGILPKGIIFSANGTAYDSMRLIDLESGSLIISGEPTSGFDGFRFQQIGVYQMDFVLTVTVTTSGGGSGGGGGTTPSEPTGETVSVRFDPNGGLSEITTMSVKKGRSVLLPEANWVDHCFQGWFTDRTGGTYVGQSGSRYVVNSSIVLYAQWTDPKKEVANCYLMASHDGITKAMYFDVVESISDVVTSNLTSVSTIVFGASNRYIMDLGNSRRITLSISRVNPRDYDDGSDDQRRWTNGKWLREFINMIDFWQNFGRDPATGKNTGGMRFHFEPPQGAEELYPAIDKNVFIVGSISPSYEGPQKIQMSIPLQIAGMDITGGGNPTETVTYTGTGITGNVTQSFVKGSMVPVMGLPSEWEGQTNNRILYAWSGSDDKTYYPGELALLTGEMTMTAKWAIPSSYVYTINDNWTAPSEGHVVIHAVGGGGAGATCKNDAILVGGGGGAGRARIQTIPVTAGEVIGIMIGAGGKPITPGGGDGGLSNGGDGKDTVITLDNVEAFRAEGGKGGRKPTVNDSGGPYTAPGGMGWGSGGTSNIPRYIEKGFFIEDCTLNVKGGDGEVLTPNLESNGGKGRMGGNTTNTAGAKSPYMGGSGGGASGFRVTAGGKTYSSIGGDGGILLDANTVVAPGTGAYGGGGGSGPKSSGGAGGDGIVVIFFYKE